MPSLLGNANERAWETQKKTLYTRFSQALPLLPSLNGYGELEGTFSNGDTQQNVTTDTAAEGFVRDGLTKVMKITNICAIPSGKTGSDAAKYIKDCGLPDKITAIDGSATINLSNIMTVSGFNSQITGKITSIDENTVFQYEQLDNKPAAFETTNGESILVYYNPNCQPNFNENSQHFSEAKICANFVYDLNGQKGPNTVGKDIGFITALYSTDPSVVAPVPYPTDIVGLKQSETGAKCKEMDENAKVPNLDEGTSMFYNRQLLGQTTQHYWTSSTNYKGDGWIVSWLTGLRFTKPDDTYKRVRCIKR